MTGNGKIARLPRAVRDELNRRMDDGQTGTELLPWLNGLPKVKKFLAEHFAGRPIAKQNLYEWRLRGHSVWLARRETLDHACELTADAKEFAAATEGKLAERLATVLATRYAEALDGWNGVLTAKFRRQLRVLRGLCQEITCLRRGDHSGARLALQQQRQEHQRGKTDEEMQEQFECWLQTPAGRAWRSKNWFTDEEIKRRLDEIYGRVPIPPEESARRDELRESPIHCAKIPNPDSQIQDPVKPSSAA